MTVLMVYLVFILIILILCIVSAYFINRLIVRNYTRKKVAKSNKELNELMEKHLEMDDINAIDGEEIKKVISLISTKYGLQAYNNIYTRYFNNNGFDEKIEAYINRTIDYKVLLDNKIVRDRYRKSYILHLLGKFHMNSKDVIDFSLEALNDESLYTRTNAFRVASNSKNVSFFLDSLKIINDSDYYFNKKIIIDNIDNYNGDSSELNNELLKRIHTYKDEIKSILIEHFTNDRFSNKDAIEIMKSFVEGDKKECIIAATKYFGKIYDFNASKSILKNMEKDDGDIKAISAKVLSQYESEETHRKLVEGLSDRNWFVRFNCAFSILNFDNVERSIEEINDGADAYAKEILLYAMFSKGMIDFDEYERTSNKALGVS